MSISMMVQTTLLLMAAVWLSAGHAAAQQAPPGAGLQLWLDASEGASLAVDADGRVTRWRDRSGRGHDATPPSDDRTPVLVADGMNAKPVVDYLSAKWGAKPVWEDRGWTRVGSLGETPKRISDKLPLSDQQNAGKWTRYELMCDEFDANKLDPAKWHPTNPQWLGRQPALFWTKNVKVSDGKLHLTMRKEEAPNMPKGYHTYTSAAVKSKGTVLYGYFEIKAKPMRSHGSSAFWFYNNQPEEWTEIDVFEIGGGAPGFERKYNMNLHVFHTPTEKKHWSKGGMWLAPWDLADEYHVYGLEWDKERLQYYVDGVLVRKVKNTHWHQPLTLNFDSETMPTWFGLPRDEDLPSTYSVEYVRAWKRAG